IQYGIEEFAEDCRNGGISGLIIPDLPYEEVDLVRDAMTNEDIALIPLVSLTSPPDRIEKITAAGEGFIYAVTVNGITGVRDGFEGQLEEHLKRLKAVSSVPVLAGFGISTPDQVALIGSFADGVIVGSAIVTALHKGDFKTVEKLVNASKNKVPSI
ncbi:tryptophan synthase subunit alpha, partial [Microvirga sp. 3-52]|nr:tryptophan synthase subunit alpha [Microvirga sp. 3-52]